MIRPDLPPQNTRGMLGGGRGGFFFLGGGYFLFPWPLFVQRLRVCQKKVGRGGGGGDSPLEWPGLAEETLEPWFHVSNTFPCSLGLAKGRRISPCSGAQAPGLFANFGWNSGIK